MTPRTISSAQTFLVKAVLPLLWTLGFGLATIRLWNLPFKEQHLTVSPEIIKFTLLGTWVLGIVSQFIYFIPAKRVRMDDHSLYISNYCREIIIPIKSLVEIREKSWKLPNNFPVTLCFNPTTEFGNHISFLPRKHFSPIWNPNPDIAELRRLAGLGDTAYKR